MNDDRTFEPYRSFKVFLKEKFHNQKVRKIPIDAGFSCPNKDGSKSKTGCIFCDPFGSGPIKGFGLPIPEQIERFMKAHPGCKYIAYYQAHSNTYAPVAELRRKYEIIFKWPDIVGLFIGTRPDAIAEEVYLILGDLNQRTYLTVELGLQSIHANSLQYLNRSHTYQQFLDTFYELKARNIDVVVHLIVGIPGETRTQMLQTIQEMNRIKPAGIKFHPLHILKSTPLYQRYKKEKLKLLEKEEYCELMVTLLQHLDPSIVIHRLTGERDREIFFAPRWALNKIDVINCIRSKMIERNTSQGEKLPGI